MPEFPDDAGDEGKPSDDVVHVGAADADSPFRKDGAKADQNDLAD